MIKKLTLTLLAATGLYGSGIADTTLLMNENFTTDESWITGYNAFVGDDWQAFIGDEFTLDDYVDPSGDGFIFRSYDNIDWDRMEHYLQQEWGAGPAGGATPSIFQTGDVLVFKGKAKIESQSGAVVMRPYIKTLGYNEFGWERQVKPDYTEYAEITSELQEFELSITFPDLAVDDSYQVVQFGFEISTDYVDGAMGAGAIYFQDLEGYVQGGGDGNTWYGYDVTEDGWAEAAGWLGWVNVTGDPWILSLSLDKYIYIPGEQSAESGAWMYIPK